MRMLHSSISQAAIVQAQHLAILMTTEALLQRSTRDEQVSVTMTYIDGLRRFDLPLGASVRAAITDAKRQLELRRAYRRTYDELNTLSERELTDLGLARCDIERIAHEAVYTN